MNIRKRAEDFNDMRSSDKEVNVGNAIGGTNEPRAEANRNGAAGYDNPTFSYADAFGDGNSERQAIEDKYGYLREQTAQDLLNKQIQTEMAKQAAQRSLNMNMAAQGLDKTGYFGTANTMLQSDFASQQNSNISEYQEAIRNQGLLKNDELSKVGDTTVGNLTAALENVSDVDTAVRYLANMGITATRDENGNFSLSGNALNGISPTNRNAILNALTAVSGRGLEAQQQADASRAEILAQSISNFVANGGTDMNFLINRLRNNGLAVTQSDNGKFNVEGGTYTADMRRSIETALEDAYEQMNPTYSDYSNLVSSGVKTIGGYELNSDKGVDRELRFVFNSDEGRKYAKDGNAILLENKNGDVNSRLYLKYMGSGWRVISSSEFLRNNPSKTYRLSDGKIEKVDEKAFRI